MDIVRLQNTLAKVQATQSDSQTALQGNQADLMAEMQTLNRNMEMLSSHLNESENRMSLLSTRLDDLDKNLSNRLDLLSEMMSGSKLAAPPSPSTLFNLAYGDFTRRRYEQALKGFDAYLQQYRDTAKAAEAQFYKGECRAALENWPKALEEYDAVLVKYSTSTMVPAAYLQKGVALEKMGKVSEALAVYDAIVRKYPHRQEAASARSRAEALKNGEPEGPKPQ